MSATRQAGFFLERAGGAYVPKVFVGMYATGQKSTLSPRLGES
ncbi:MAG: hypothetical protein WB763_05680 [Terriglobia bacterium]|jgi:hypothetical protein